MPLPMDKQAQEDVGRAREFHAFQFLSDLGLCRWAGNILPDDVVGRRSDRLRNGDDGGWPGPAAEQTAATHRFHRSLLPMAVAGTKIRRVRWKDFALGSFMHPGCVGRMAIR
jgi:hypothetical protein